MVPRNKAATTKTPAVSPAEHAAERLPRVFETRRRDHGAERGRTRTWGGHRKIIVVNKQRPLFANTDGYHNACTINKRYLRR